MYSERLGHVLLLFNATLSGLPDYHVRGPINKLFEPPDIVWSKIAALTIFSP